MKSGLILSTMLRLYADLTMLEVRKLRLEGRGEPGRTALAGRPWMDCQ